ncbi:hypothetical protein ACIA74_35235 [Streptomyces sp. NPDC051658]|uniref:hypothetical protein n=1 Tax=Streptomyces sp. NPDC051658 TaxID=3365667 RepID=UPI0037AB964F
MKPPADEKAARPGWSRPAEKPVLPGRFPDGGAAAASATANARKGELESARTKKRPVASLLKEHRAAGTKATEGDRGQRAVQEPDPEGIPAHDQSQGEQREGQSGQDPAKPSGHGGEVGFVELDVESLLPPLWGQSPQEHEEEVQDYKQGLARDRGAGKGKVAAFVGSRRAKSGELAALGPQLTGQVNGAKAAALARIRSAETSGVAAVQSAVRSARASVQAQGQAARGQVEASHAAAVAAMGTAASGAGTAMDGGARTADQAVTGKQNDQLSALGGLYARTEQRIRDAAAHAGDLAVGEARKRAEQYRAKMIHRNDNFWDGPLTDNRCKARADAAKAVGDGYKEQLPKAADEPINDINEGRPDAENTVREFADDVRKSLDTVLKQSRQGLADAHKQSVRSADDAKTGALQGIGQAVSSAEAGLARLETSQLASIRAQAAQQRQIAERQAAGACAAISRSLAAARAGLDRSLQEFVRILSTDEAPDPDQLEEVLRDTGDRFDERLEGTAEGLRARAAQAGQSLAALGERTASGISQTASAASQSAQQTATSTRQTLTTTATRTASGLRQVQQYFAETAKTMQSGQEDANKQVLQGLDKAYSELTGKFKEGADGQVKAVADGLDKAATGTGKDEIHPKITEEADKAAAKVKPRWVSVLIVVLVIVVVIALTLVLGPLIIGPIGALAGAMGASAAAAGVIGTVVGGAIVGAVAGAVGQVVSNVCYGLPPLEGVGKAALFGAIGGAIGGGVSAAVARTALSTGVRVGIEMAVEAGVEVGLGAADAAITGQSYTLQDALIGVATSVAVTGVMAHPRVQAMTERVSTSVTASLEKLGIKIPELPADVKTPDASDAPEVNVPKAPDIDMPNVPAAPKPDGSGPVPDGSSPGAKSEVDAPGPGPRPDGDAGGSPQPGRGPDGATSWDGSNLDPTGGKGSADGPVRPRDQADIEAELRSVLGPLGDRVDVRIDPGLPGRTVRVHYDIDDNGLITNVRMAVGPSATPTDIRLHAPTARTMMRYGGLSGRVRQLLRQVTEWVGIHGSPPVGSMAWEARLELRKLPAVIADRARIYADADPAARPGLEAELNYLIQQVNTHANTLKEWNLDPGRGYVAADSEGLKAAKNLGYTDADLPDGHVWRQPKGRPLELVQLDASTKKHWFIPPTDENPLGSIVDQRPETAANPKPRFDADQPITREEAFDKLGGNDESKPLGKFIKVLIDEGVIGSEAEFIAKMPDPAGRLYDDVRHVAKIDFAKQLAGKVESHADLLRISKELHGSDRGPLGEAWYEKNHAPDGNSQVVIPKDAVDGVTLEKPRRLDLVEDDTIVEIKNISKYDKEIEGQLNDLLKIPGKEISVDGEKRPISLVRVAFLDPQGVHSNASWLFKFLKANGEADLEFQVFNTRGESRVLTPEDWKSLDFSTAAGRDFKAWLDGTTAEATGGGQ